MTTESQLNRGIELVSHDVRAEILLALARQRREQPHEETLGFAELRKRVGHEDPGNFNYHLKRLLGNLVEKTEAGYRLSDVGGRFVALLISGRFDPDTTREFPDEEWACPICGGPSTVSYDDGLLRTECENDHGSQMDVGPELLDSYSISETLNIATRRSMWEVKSIMDGVCPECEGHTTQTVERLSDEVVPVLYEWVCETCGMRTKNTPAGCVLFHPATVSFCHRRGVNVFERAWDTFVRNVENGTIESEDPLRIRVDVSLDGETLSLTLDESATVIDVTERGATKPETGRK